MNIHEHQAKELLAKYGVSVPYGIATFNIAEATAAAKSIAAMHPNGVLVVKAQIHAGGRGKGGGVKVVKSMDAAKEAAEKMFGMTLVTPQTGPQGKVVKRVYIEVGSNIEKEYYLSAVLDRQSSCVTFIASTEGGMDIEEVAEHNPEKIVKVSIDPATGMKDFHVRLLSFALGFTGQQMKDFAKIVRGIYNAMFDTDAMQIEINPLVVTKEGSIIALDAKFNLDDNALFRHPEIAAMRDENEEDPLETKAAQHELNYIKMEGNIGCMVNGAGLAMATMDIIKLYGGQPANFLDVGGGATKDRVTEALKIILSDTNVKGVLINIFGGIMRCDIIAQGVVEAAKQIGIKVPIVLRLEGTNAEQGKEILRNSGLSLIPANDLADAAAKIVQEIKKV